MLPFFATAQESMNMSLLSNLDLPDLPTRFGSEYNDCWGYTTSTGVEIAIIGGTEDIFFIDVSIPANPDLIYTYHVENSPSGTTNQSLWRDFKSYGDYVYAVADEGTSGLLIFDMTDAPTTITMVKQTVAFFNKTHNIYIDEENGRLYAAGSSSVSNGLVIIDLISNPADPVDFWNVPLNGAGGGYVHDVFVRDNIAYCSHGSLQKLQMYDFSNLPNFTVEGTIEDYPDPGYNHSSWLNEDGTKLVMCDETHGSDVKLVDVTDPLNISSDDFKTFYSELLGPDAPSASVAHNPFILGNLVYLSYYHDGVQVFNIANPDDISVLAYYDTYPDNDGYTGYDGCWGVYPFFSSGIIIGSDQNYGLYVLQIDELPLAIDFVAFEAYRHQSSVRLDWVIADASFGNRFEVNRSADGGVTFVPVGYVDLVKGKDHYEFYDHSAAASVKYIYRIDFLQDDGSHVPSPLRSVRAVSGDLTFRVANPVSAELRIDVLRAYESLEVGLYNIEGRAVIREKVIAPGNRMEFDLSGVPAGHYVLSIQTGERSENMIIQKAE
jgi:choice-of-anchor B domain-containing protein